MRLRLPEYFNENECIQSVFNDDISIVDYKVYSSNEKVYAFSKHNMLIFVIKGIKYIKLSDEEVIVNSGEFIFVKKGNYIMNQIVDTENGNFESLVISLSDNFICGFIKKHLNSSIFEAPTKEKDNIRLRSFKYSITPYLNNEVGALIVNLNRKSEYAQKIFELKIEEILLVIINEEDSDYKFRNYLLKLSSLIGEQDFKSYMENNYDKPLKIEELAKMFGNSLTSFKRRFSNTFNDTPKNWINRMRIEKAKYLLNSTDLNITEICFEIGYNNLSHFIRLFKRSTGTTPLPYRNNKQVGPYRTKAGRL